MNNKKSKTLLVPVLFSILFVSSLSGMNLAYAIEPGEDPHTKVQGQLQITKKVQDGMAIISYTFSSADLDQKYGKMKIYREETFPVGDKSLQESIETKSATMRFMLGSESAKLEQYQDAVNDGMPLKSYIKWDVLRPSTQTSSMQQISPVSWNLGENLIRPMSHDQQWTHETDAWSPSDPIATIWDDTDDVVQGSMVGAGLATLLDNGWDQDCIGGDQYIQYNGQWIKQDYHVFNQTPDCDTRDHLRMWGLTDDLAIGAAHEEILTGQYYDIYHTSSSGPAGWEDNVWHWHEVQDFESAEAEVNNAFTGCWSVNSDNHWMDNGYTRKYYDTNRQTLIVTAYNDGYASEISKSC